MGMQSLRFRRQRSTRNEPVARPPALLTIGICLLVAATIVAIMLAAMRFGVIHALSNLLK